MNDDIDNLPTCGCCESGDEKPEHANLPGQPSLCYRIGTHSAFLRRMKALLATHKFTGKGTEAADRPLGGLTTRSSEDPAIALLDAWAMVGDVITFYQERIANEGFLRTATERRSVLEMARAIGYELSPGVSASTYLAFTVDDAPNSPKTATIKAGTQVMSIPATQGELPQTFETSEDFEARIEWNSLKPQLTEKQAIKLGIKELYLKGTSTNLKPGDGLLIIGNERKDDTDSEDWDFRRIQSVTMDKVGQYTKVTWNEDLGWKKGDKVHLAQKGVRVYTFRQVAALFGCNAPDWQTVKAAIFGAGLLGEYFQSVDLDDTAFKFWRIDPSVDFDWQNGSPDSRISVNSFSIRWTGWLRVPATGNYTFVTYSDDGVRLWVNGQKIIDHWNVHPVDRDIGAIYLTAGKMYPIKLEYYENLGGAIIKLAWIKPDNTAEEIIPQYYLCSPGEYSDWPGLNISSISDSIPDTVHLDKVYPQIVPGSWLLLSQPKYWEVYEVLEAVEESRHGFTLSGKTTRVKLKGEHLLQKFDDHIRDTVVFAQSEELELAEKPVIEPVYGNQIILDSLSPDIFKGQALLFTGKRARIVLDPAIEAPYTNPCLVADNGDSTIDLKAGDSLQLAGLPIQVNNSGTPELTPADLIVAMANQDAQILIKWRLRYKDGSVGSLVAGSNQVRLQSATKEDPTVSEISFIADVSPDDHDPRDRTTVTLKNSLEYYYDRATLTINANVVAATHGETVGIEVLGGGDGAQPNQRFSLKKPPLTYVAAANTRGARSTLEVRVNDVLWDEVSSLYGKKPTDNVYVVRTDNEAKARVIFGDGKSGARLPTGQENINAAYRSGIGNQGEVGAGSLTLLKSRPFGIRAVNNPLAATGAAEPEKLESARTNAPMTVLTLDRIVSLKDYENFVRGFSGIGKAQAVHVWDGENYLVHITIADDKGNGVDRNLNPYKNLMKAMRDASDPTALVQVDSLDSQTFIVKANVLYDAKYLHEDVKARIKKALLDAFSFDKRAFGQPVAPAEIISTIQQIKGVIAVDLDTPSGVKTAEKARRSDNFILPAQLLTISPSGIDLTMESAA